MEKIQAAIAKARAEREGQPLPGPGSATTATAPVPRPPQPDAARRQAVDAAWAGLRSFAADPVLMERGHIVTYQGGAAAGAFDALRTRILQQMRANGWRRLAITSPGTGCGKSTLALNLGFNLARQRELRTIVAELDLRRPSLGRVLGVTDPLAFARVLEGTAPFAEHALRHGDNLAFALNQSPVRHPAELLASVGTATALAGIEAQYAPDIMIFDLPPLLVTDDAMAFVAHADCALLVAAAETTTIKEIDRCERELAAQTNVIGVVLNKCRYMEKGQGYGYYE